MNKLNLKIIAPIFVALLMSTIWILSSKNNTGNSNDKNKQHNKS
jgi:hypothetical protein